MDSITSLFKGFFGPKEQSVLGIDVGSSSIKVVQIKRKGGKAILETYGEISLGPYAGFEIGQATNLPPEKLAVALKDLIKEANVTTRNAGVAIPIKASLVTVMEMPAVPERELASVVPLEARKYIPVPISEVQLDWSIIPEDDDSQADLPEDVKAVAMPDGIPKVKKTHLLVVAIHNDVLAHYSTLLTAAEVETSFFEIEIFSAIRSVLDQDVRPIAVIDMGAASTKLYIIERGAVRTSHIINRGSQDITLDMSRSMSLRVDAAEKMKRNFGNNGATNDGRIKEISDLILDSIFSEAQSIILAYQRKHNKNVAKVILTGGGAALKGVAEKSFASLQIETVYGAPFDKVQAPAFLEDVLRVTGREFAVSVGIALRKLQESQ